MFFPSIQSIRELEQNDIVSLSRSLKDDIPVCLSMCCFSDEKGVDSILFLFTFLSDGRFWSKSLSDLSPTQSILVLFP